MTETPTTYSSGNRQSLDRCPMCRYSLRGLPASHRCPECGFEYDEHTSVWRPKFGTPFRGFMAVFFAVNLFSLVMQTMFVFQSRPAKIFMMILILAFLALPFVSWRMRPFVAVTPIGILHRWNWRTSTIEWNKILCAPGFEADVAFIEPQDGMSFTKYLPNKAAQAEFRRAVNDGKKRYDSPTKTYSGTRR